MEGRETKPKHLRHGKNGQLTACKEKLNVIRTRTQSIQISQLHLSLKTWLVANFSSSGGPFLLQI